MCRDNRVIITAEIARAAVPMAMAKAPDGGWLRLTLLATARTTS